MRRGNGRCPEGDEVRIENEKSDEHDRGQVEEEDTANKTVTSTGKIPARNGGFSIGKAHKLLATS